MTEAPVHRILLAVSGMTPQIITETLYALSQAGTPWLPDEILLITTQQGKQNAELQLLEDKKRFVQFLADYKITYPITFNAKNIILIKDAKGRVLNDLRTPKDNEAAADTICEAIRELTADADTELHVSLAGGRKTMGFYAGYALSLFGRPQDRLSHVLVSENYESNRDFFYPTPSTQVIYDRDNKPLDASQAQVWLAEIPFVRLRNRLPPALLSGAHSFSAAVELARRATEAPLLTLYPSRKHCEINGVQTRLNATGMALLLWAAKRKQAKHYIGTDTGATGRERKEDLREFQQTVEDHDLALDARTETLLEEKGLTQKWLQETSSKLNAALSKALGDELAAHCKLASRDFDGRKGYALPDYLEISIRN